MNQNNDDAWKYGLAFWILVFIIGIYSLFLDSPGPSRLTPVCVIDGNTIQYHPGIEYSGDYALAADPQPISVGNKGALYEKLDSLTLLSNGRWQARFSNTITHRKSTRIYKTCKKEP